MNKVIFTVHKCKAFCIFDSIGCSAEHKHQYEDCKVMSIVTNNLLIILLLEGPQNIVLCRVYTRDKHICTVALVLFYQLHAANCAIFY